MTINSQPGEGNNLKLETAEETEKRLAGESGVESSVMHNLHEAQKTGNPALIAEAQVAADEKYMGAPELHDSHVDAFNQNKMEKLISQHTKYMEAFGSNLGEEVARTFLSSFESYRFADTFEERKNLVIRGLANANFKGLYPLDNLLEESSKVLGISSDEIMATIVVRKARIEFSEKYKLDPKIFDLFLSEESKEIKEQKFRQLMDEDFAERSGSLGSNK